jgi:hypothetical protein
VSGAARATIGRLDVPARGAPAPAARPRARPAHPPGCIVPLMPYDESMVARLLEAQGYAVPASDLPEITERVNTALANAAQWDALEAHRDEAWWPFLEVPRAG